jgi:hypothetical protein
MLGHYTTGLQYLLKTKPLFYNLNHQKTLKVQLKKIRKQDYYFIFKTYTENNEKPPKNSPNKAKTGV